MASAPPPKPKRGPTVLVTDARESPYRQSQRPPMVQRSSTRLISVDNVLQYASEIPSGQRRTPLPQRTTLMPTPSARQSADPKLSGRMMQNHIPTRTSKLSEKLVLLPETEQVEDEKGDFDEDDDHDTEPLKDEEMERRKKPPTSMKEKSYAERMPKSSRTEKLPRVTAYCTAQAYKMRATADFVRTKHGAKAKLYDDCLYTVYHLPLLPGNEGYRIQSSPVIKSPGGKAVLDEEIERNERHEYREGFFGEEQYGVRNLDEAQGGTPPRRQHSNSPSPQNSTPPDTTHPTPIPPQPPSPTADTAPLTTAELFIFSYGVLVFWNFTIRQERDLLADLTFHSTIPTPLAIRPQRADSFETEEFHFQYNTSIPRPRVFNDMITLRSGDHMIKLAMSHAIAQSTKLSLFEERMADTMDSAQSIPRRLALTGDLGMSRTEVVRILGRLFMSRVDVNLSSNMLDVPNFFWDAEPTLHPLYTAVREYLEIQPRIQALNERCRVFLDLAEMLSESIADRKMRRLTWGIIALILVSILVTGSEVVLRFGLLSRERGGGLRAGVASSRVWGLRPPAMDVVCGWSDL